MKQLQLNTLRQEEAETVLYLLQLGVVTALQEKAVTLEEMEKTIFNPYTASQLKQLALSEKVVEGIEIGCELDDIRTLIPDNYEKSIHELKDMLLSQLKDRKERPVSQKTNKWIEEVE